MSRKKTLGEAKIEDFLVTKQEIDQKLWNDILNKSKGTEEEKILACRLFFENYRRIPDEADALIKGLASPHQPEGVRKAIALEIAKERVKIPAGLYGELLFVLHSDVNKEVRDIVEPKFKQIKETFVLLADAIAQAQVSFVESTTRLISRYQTMITRTALNSWQKIWEGTKFLREPEFKEFEFNWLAFLPIDRIRKLYEMHKQGKDEDIKKLLIGLGKSREYLDQVIEEMNEADVFKRRVSAIKDALDAHCNGKYTLSIPTLLPQIEGILWDIAEEKGIAKGTEIVTKTGKREVAKSAKPLVKKTDIRDLISENVADYFLEKIYTKGFRHGILHGRKINYGNEEDSVKLVLFLRTLLEVGD